MLISQNSWHLIHSYIPKNCINCSNDHKKVKKFKNCYLKELDETTFYIHDYPLIFNQIINNYILKSDINDDCSTCHNTIASKDLVYIEKCDNCNDTYCSKCNKSEWEENIRTNSEYPYERKLIYQHEFCYMVEKEEYEEQLLQQEQENTEQENIYATYNNCNIYYDFSEHLYLKYS
eukprot:392730_1